MTPDLGDLHAGEPGRLGAQFALETTKGFVDLGVRFVVIGGWAVRALGSPLPSIDLDCLIHADEWWRREVHDFIEERTHIHRSAHADSYLEVDGLDHPNTFWNNPAAYKPIELFKMAGTDNVQLELWMRLSIGRFLPWKDCFL